MLNFLHQLVELFYVHKALCCTRAFLSQHLSHGRRSSSSSLPPKLFLYSCARCDWAGADALPCRNWSALLLWAVLSTNSSSAVRLPPPASPQELVPLPCFSWWCLISCSWGNRKNCPGWRVFCKEGSNHCRGCKPGDCKPALRGSCCVAELIAMPLNALSVLRVFVSWTDWSWAGSSSRLS